MKKLQCETCGGIIDRQTLTCRSCGMQYQYDQDHVLRIITEDRRTEIISGRVIIPDEILATNTENRVEFAIHQIANNMARQLIPYMEWERVSDPTRRQTEINARIRVARPDSGPFYRPIYPEATWEE